MTTENTENTTSQVSNAGDSTQNNSSDPKPALDLTAGSALTSLSPERCRSYECVMRKDKDGRDFYYDPEDGRVIYYDPKLVHGLEEQFPEVPTIPSPWDSKLGDLPAVGSSNSL